MPSSVCRKTVTGRLDGLDRSTVTGTVARLPDRGSAAVASATVTVGGGLASRIVPTAVPLILFPFDTFRRTANVSVASDTSSARTGTPNVADVLPAAMVTLPVAAV